MSLVKVALLDIDSVKKFFGRAPDVARDAARFAVNFGAKRAQQIGSKQMRKEVAFSAEYLGLQNRFKVSKRATASDLSAEVRARDRPTSLARFRADTPTFGAPKKGQARNPIRVQVRPGRTVTMEDAAFVKLRNNNIGIISKGRPGARKDGENEKYRWFRRNKKGEKVATDYYLRYGPSVNQVFQGVRSVIERPVLDATVKEFLRQFTRLSK